MAAPVAARPPRSCWRRSASSTASTRPLPSGGESVNELCARFLRARNGDVTAEEEEEGREAQRHPARRERRARPPWPTGRYTHFGAGCTLGVALDMHPLKTLSRYNTWLNEGFSQRLAERRAQQWVIVIDALGWHLRQATPRAMGVLRDMANTDAMHYPERLAAIVVVNALDRALGAPPPRRARRAARDDRARAAALPVWGRRAAPDAMARGERLSRRSARAEIE